MSLLEEFRERLHRETGSPYTLQHIAYLVELLEEELKEKDEKIAELTERVNNLAEGVLGGYIDLPTTNNFDSPEDIFAAILKGKEQYKKHVGKYPTMIRMSKDLWTHLGKPDRIHDIPVKVE